MSAIPEKLQEILDDFKTINDRNERTEMLIYYADQFKEVPERIATRPFGEDRRVQYCESEAYVWVEPDGEGRLQYYFAVENPQGLSAKAMAAILNQTVSGAAAEQVAAISSDMVFTLFGNEISMGKGQGLTGMVSMVKALAEEYLASRSGE